MAKEWIVTDEDLGCDGAYFSHQELVRCKDCKYCSVDRHADGNVPNYVCIEMDCGVEADSFCSWGERREDDAK